MRDHPEWLVELLGPSANLVMHLVPDALSAGHERARNTQDVSGLRQLHPYGNTSWLVVFEELVLALGQLPGARLMRPKGATYDLIVINETVICPCRVKRATGRLKDARLKPTRVRRALSQLNHGAVADQTLDLSAVGYDEEDLFDPAFIIPKETASQVLFVPFEVDADTGLVAAGMGRGTLLLDGTVEWADYMELELDIRRAAPRLVRSSPESRFDGGALPEPQLQPRVRPVQNPEALDDESSTAQGMTDDGTDE